MGGAVSKYCYEEQIKKVEMGWSCSAHGRYERYIQSIDLETRMEGSLGRPRCNGRIILKWKPAAISLEDMD
jgi:hypothetical protein